MRRNLSTSWSSYGRYSTDLFSDEAVRIVKAHDRNTMGPLFLYLAHLAVHSANPYTPLQAPPETVSKFSSIQDENRRYLYSFYFFTVRDSKAIKYIILAVFMRLWYRNLMNLWDW